MRRWMSLAVVAAALTWTGAANAQCAEVCDETQTLDCDGDERTTSATTHVVVRCADDLTTPNVGPNGICGQICVDGVVMIAGWAGTAVQGCSGVGGNAVSTATVLGGNCYEFAVNACEGNGCSVEESGSGPCPANVHKRGATLVVDERPGGACRNDP